MARLAASLGQVALAMTFVTVTLATLMIVNKYWPITSPVVRATAPVSLVLLLALIGLSTLTAYMAGLIARWIEVTSLAFTAVSLASLSSTWLWTLPPGATATALRYMLLAGVLGVLLLFSLLHVRVAQAAGRRPVRVSCWSQVLCFAAAVVCATPMRLGQLRFSLWGHRITPATSEVLNMLDAAGGLFIALGIVLLFVNTLWLRGLLKRLLLARRNGS